MVRGTISIVELIARKRDGAEHSSDEIERIISAFSAGEMTDYQMSAWLMAVYLRGMTDAETVTLTRAMLHSGDVLDLGSVAGFKVDKHSTGGVGDKVSISLAPLVAACGVPVPMVSGRGLGHTGGTLDKLEAIPGFNVSLDTDAFTRIVGEVGACMIGQTARIAPADKRIYALRDVTATVESIPLIVASILSKKLAEGIDGLVLDVKVGRGAFMKSEESARALAKALVSVGTAAGKRVVALLTRMDTPLGRAIGNANETREAIDVLFGRGPDDLMECTLALGAEMLVMAGACPDLASARRRLAIAINDRSAARKLAELIKAQGGDPLVVDDPRRLPQPPMSFDVHADHTGFVTGVDALELGLAAVAMGAGRTRTDQAVDPAVGIYVVKKPGDRVAAGDVLATVGARSESTAQLERIRAAFTIGDAAPEVPPLLVERFA